MLNGNGYWFYPTFLGNLYVRHTYKIEASDVVVQARRIQIGTKWERALKSHVPMYLLQSNAQTNEIVIVKEVALGFRFGCEKGQQSLHEQNQKRIGKIFASQKICNGNKSNTVEVFKVRDWRRKLKISRKYIDTAPNLHGYY